MLFTTKPYPQLARRLLLHFAVISLLFEQFIFLLTSTANAADLPITVDGSTNTKITAAANNVPIVNIAAPNSGGLSHNKFTHYNVNSQGLILNNAATSASQVTSTKIGGLITGNSNLNASASIILNEVTGNSKTHLNGYTEIAGRQADLIIANPNGISMAGAGFINLSRLTAVVGSANQINPHPNNLTFALDNSAQIANGFLPELTISGSGVDLEEVSSTQLVASLMNIVAPIYADDNQVSLLSGDKQFNHIAETVTSDNSSPSSTDAIAIDASSLAKIQAGKIYILATKEGFGIKYSADLLASRNGIIIDALGNIEYNNISSEAGDIEVTSSAGSITQSGISQTEGSGDNINLTAFDDIINEGQFLSVNDINLTTDASFSNNSFELNLSDNDFTITAIDLTNLGILSAGNNLSVTATSSINNSGKLIANNSLNLGSSQITNSDSIYSNNIITITASDYLTNNYEIISDGTDSESEITINAKTLNNNQEISANNVTINVDSLNNNTANSSILALNDVNLNAISIDNSNAEIQAHNNLTIRNLSLNNSEIADLFSITSKATKLTNIDGTFIAGNLIDFDLGSADYTIIGNLESAGNTKITANNIINQTDLQAINGYIQITANDAFINGILDGDNADIQVVAGTNLSIIAENILSNYSILSSGTDLTITSLNNNINNNIEAEIIGGNGATTLQALNGTVNQNSLNSLISNGDLTLDVEDFVNTGRVDIDGDFTLNVSNDLTNTAYAMIYSSGDMELNVVNDLTNNFGAVIYSEGDLTIQKYATTSSSYDAADNKMNKLENISAEIIAYSGDVNIYANEIDNKRKAIPIFNLITSPNGSSSYNNGTWNNHNLHTWIKEASGCFGDRCSSAWHRFNTTQGTLNSNSIESDIFAGNNMTIEATKLTNNSSNIHSIGNLTVNVDELYNSSYQYFQNAQYTLVYDLGRAWHNYSFYNSVSESASMKFGGSISGNIRGKTNNNAIKANDATATKQNLVDIRSIETSELSSLSKINLDLTSYLNGPDTQGLFIKSTNPNDPLFETRSQFIDQSKYYGSDYFYDKIGVDLEDLATQMQQQDRRMIGDGFFQNKILSEQLRSISDDSFLLSEGETSANDEIKSLLDNAADEYSRLGLTTNTSLTQTQINSLEKDIVWFESEVIDGATYIVPKIYLTQIMRDNLLNGSLVTKSTIYAAGDINIISDSLTNSGSIISGNDLNISTSSDIINENFSDIAAGNDLTLTSLDGSISNFSKLSAENSISLTAAEDITNSSTVLTNDSNLIDTDSSAYIENGNDLRTNSGSISSETMETAEINAASITINAGNDFNNYAADITTTGDISITAGDDINIETLKLRNRTETYWGHKSDGGTTITDNTANIGSNINIGGDLNIITTGLSQNLTNISSNQESNINITGSDITTDGDLNIAAKDQVNIISAIDTYHKEEQSSKKGSFHSRSDFSTTDRATNISSNLISNNNITITSGADTNIIASNLTGSQDGNIAVGTYNDFDSSSSTYGQMLFNDDANLNILSGLDTYRYYSETTKTKMGFSLENALMAAVMMAAIVSTGGAASAALIGGSVGSAAAIGSVNKEKSTSSIFRYSESVVSSNLNFGNNLTIFSMNESTFEAAKIEAMGDIAINTGGNLNIETATESSQFSHESDSEGSFFLKSGNSGYYNAKVINTEISSNNGTNSNLTFDIGNNIIASYNKNSGDNINNAIASGLSDSILYGDFSKNSKLAYLHQLDSTKTLYNPIEEISTSWSQTSRGLTTAGQIVVAITATALTGGAMNPVNGSLLQGALVSGASAIASSASIAAINAGLNADGDLLKQLKTISKETWDSTTSKENIKNILIATAAGAFSVGATNYMSTGSVTTAANSANTFSSTTSTIDRVRNNFQNSFQEVAINNLSSAVAQSAINGDSFSDIVEQQNENILIYTMAKVVANEIGRSYHGTTDEYGNITSASTISKSQQLTLHAALGATVASLTDTNIVTGAASGVIGELAAEQAHKSGSDVDTSIRIAGLTSAIATATYGGLTNQSDEEVSANIWEGSRIGENAGRNNALYIGGTVRIPGSDLITGKSNDYDIHSGVQIGLGLEEKYIGTNGHGSSLYVVPEFGIGGYINVIPHNEGIDKSFSLGYRNTVSIEYIKTDQGNNGYGVTFGVSTSPYTKIPVNITISDN